MKRHIFLLLAGFAAAPGAYAADLPVYPTEPIAAAPVMSWTGFYVGAQVGFSSSDVDNDIDITGVKSSFDYSLDDVSAGLHAGYNFDMGGPVFGVEGDIEWTNQHGSGDNAEFNPAITSYTDIDWMGSVRARIGYAFDPGILVYATGGVAFADIEYGVSAAKGFGPAISDSDTAMGWTAGLGLDYALTDHWIIRGEYRYTEFDDIGVSFSGAEIALSPNDIEMHTARFGASYKF